MVSEMCFKNGLKDGKSALIIVEGTLKRSELYHSEKMLIRMLNPEVYVPIEIKISVMIKFICFAAPVPQTLCYHSNHSLNNLLSIF